MKPLQITGASILILLFLAGDLCFGQSNAKQIWAEGVGYAAEGKFNKAIEKFEKALKVDPLYGAAKKGLEVFEDVKEEKIKSDVAVYIFKGIAYHIKEQYHNAIDEYNKANALNPKYAYCYGCRGIAYYKIGQYDRAFTDYTRAIELNPQYAAAHYNRGLAFYNRGEYDKAISDYSNAIDINPKYASAYNNRGYVYYKKGQYDKAISDYSNAIDINPMSAKAYNNRGNAYNNKGIMKNACADWKRACELGDCRYWGVVKKIQCFWK